MGRKILRKSRQSGQTFFVNLTFPLIYAILLMFKRALLALYHFKHGEIIGERVANRPLRAVFMGSIAPEGGTQGIS